MLQKYWKISCCNIAGTFFHCHFYSQPLNWWKLKFRLFAGFMCCNWNHMHSACDLFWCYWNDFIFQRVISYLLPISQMFVFSHAFVVNELEVEPAFFAFKSNSLFTFLTLIWNLCVLVFQRILNTLYEFSYTI